jgi:GNAT superfamily N-acetyltransferase
LGMNLSAPVRLEKHHIIEDFDCGNDELNKWLIRFALQNQQSDAATTFVVHTENRVIAYYSLVAGSVNHDTATLRIKKGLSNHPIPVMILARLAVEREFQGRKIGKFLLRDAILRILNASENFGIRAVLVHAKDEKARLFYEKFGFEPSPINPLTLMLLLKDARKTIANRSSP